MLGHEKRSLLAANVYKSAALHCPVTLDDKKRGARYEEGESSDCVIMGTATPRKSAGSPYRAGWMMAPHSPDNRGDHTQQRVGRAPDHPALSGLFPLRWRGGINTKKNF